MTFPRFVWAMIALGLAGCAGDIHHRVVISITDQKLIVFHDSDKIAEYPVSTSKYGIGDRPGSDETPLGVLRIKQKIGGGAPSGAVFKHRVWTGEIVRVNAPGRDPIVTRILWLEGLQDQNRDAYRRYIYIHGTPEERNIGLPVSYGCIRMRSKDVIALYDTVGVGTKVIITRKSFSPSKPHPSPTVSSEPPPVGAPSH